MKAADLTRFLLVKFAFAGLQFAVKTTSEDYSVQYFFIAESILAFFLITLKSLILAWNCAR